MMKRIRRFENKVADSAAYLYIIGAAMKLAELIKIGCKGVAGHIIELLMLIAMISLFIIAQLMDGGVISFNITMLLIVVLGAFIIGLIKIKIKRGE